MLLVLMLGLGQLLLRRGLLLRAASSCDNWTRTRRSLEDHRVASALALVGCCCALHLCGTRRNLVDCRWRGEVVLKVLGLIDLFISVHVGLGSCGEREKLKCRRVIREVLEPCVCHAREAKTNSVRVDRKRKRIDESDSWSNESRVICRFSQGDDASVGLAQKTRGGWGASDPLAL